MSSLATSGSRFLRARDSSACRTSPSRAHTGALYARIRYVVPNLPLTRLLGVRVAQAMFDIVRPLAFAMHAAPVNRMRRHFDLPPGPRDLRYAYTDADYTLYSDVAELVPTAPLPSNHQFIGPVQWSPRAAMPSWWRSIPRDKPIVYVNLGSSGQARLVPEMLDALERLPVTVMAVSAGRVELASSPNQPFHAEFLPGDQAARLASLVVCNGGSPSCYQSLAAGRPVVGIPSNMDQFLNMSLVSRSGAGILVRAGRDTGPRVALAVGQIWAAAPTRRRRRRCRRASRGIIQPAPSAPCSSR